MTEPGPPTEDGGFVEGADKTKPTSEAVDPGTRQTFTYLIVALLGVTLMGHYVTMAWLVDPADTAKVSALGKIFDVWLPVISGLAGSAATYFYTSNRR